MAHHLPAIMMDMSVLVSRLQDNSHDTVSLSDRDIPYVLLDAVIKPDYLPCFDDAFFSALVEAASENLATASGYPPLARQVCWEFHSPTSLRHMASLTGSEALLPDPFLYYGGFNREQSGNQLSVERHPVTDLLAHVRVEVFLRCHQAPVPVCISETASGKKYMEDVCPGQVLLTPAQGCRVDVESGTADSYVFYLYCNDRARSLEERRKAFENY